MELLAVLKWPIITLLAVLCGKDKGVNVEYQIRQDRDHRVYMVCHRPDVEMRIDESE